MLCLVLAQAALAPRLGTLSPGRRLPLAPCHAPCRCGRVRCDFSPAYDTTIRRAKVAKKTLRPAWRARRRLGLRPAWHSGGCSQRRTMPQAAARSGRPRTLGGGCGRPAGVRVWWPRRAMSQLRLAARVAPGTRRPTGGKTCAPCRARSSCAGSPSASPHPHPNPNPNPHPHPHPSPYPSPSPRPHPDPNPRPGQDQEPAALQHRRHEHHLPAAQPPRTVARRHGAAVHTLARTLALTRTRTLTLALRLSLILTLTLALALALTRRCRTRCSVARSVRCCCRAPTPPPPPTPTPTPTLTLTPARALTLTLTLNLTLALALAPDPSPPRPAAGVPRLYLADISPISRLHLADISRASPQACCSCSGPTPRTAASGR